MGRQNEQYWLCKLTKFWPIFLAVLLIGVITTVDGVTDICKQQQQSSFQLKKLGSTKSSEKCADLCCKDTKCHIPLRVKHHCYSISCAKADLCQIVYEQLKEFEGHRVDKRDVDENEDDQDWEHDHGQDLNVYQKKYLFDTANATSNDSGLNVSSTGVNNNVFAAFLLQETGEELARNAREVKSNVSTQKFFPSKVTGENKIYVTLNNSQERPLGDTERMLKRSTSDEDDEDEEDSEDDDKGDDDDGENSQCSHEKKFDHSVVSTRKKNYHYKHLQKKAKSLASCSKKCCKTENCILSFLIEKTCIGVLCSGDGDCHVKKDKLPRTKFELSLMKREVKSSSHENSEDKRSAVSKDGDVDGDVDGDIDEDAESREKEVKTTKKKKEDKKKKSKHKNKAHKNKSIKKHSIKSAKHKDDDVDDSNEINHPRKKTTKSNKKKAKTKKVHQHKKENIENEDGDESGEEDTEKSSSKKHHIKNHGHKSPKNKNDDMSSNNEDDKEDEESNGRNEKRDEKAKKRKDQSKEDVESGDEEQNKKEDNSKEDEDELEDKEKGEENDNGHEKSNEESNSNIKKEKSSSLDNEDNSKVHGYNLESRDMHVKKQTDEYSDDVKHLVHVQKPQNSTLFDDTVVGDETLGDQDPDGQIENDVSQGKDSIEHDNKQEGIDQDEQEKRDEGGYAKNAEETAGRDESLQMRKTPFADNDKRNDLMVAHRHYEDVEEVGDEEEAGERTNDDEEEADRDKRHRDHKAFKHRNRNYENPYKNNDYDGDDGYKYSRRAQKKSHSERHLKSSRHDHRYSQHAIAREEMREDYSGDETQDVDRHYIKFHGLHDEKENDDVDDDRKSHNYLKFHGSEKVHRKDEDSDSYQAKNHVKAHHSKKTEQSAKKETSSRSRSRHIKNNSTKSKKKKHSPESLDKEEKLIDKLEQLEEKIESKQKATLEERKKKVLDKVESLSNSLDKDEKKKSTKSQHKHEKHKGKHPEDEMDDVADFSKHNNEQSEEIVIPQSSKHREYILNDEGSGEQESGSGDINKSEKDVTEQIVLPKASRHHKYKEHRAKPEDRDSGSGDLAEDVQRKLEKFKGEKESEKHKHPHHSSKSKKTKHEKKSKKHHKKKTDEKITDISGSGEDEDGHREMKEVGYEQIHHAENNDWSQKDIVIPYVDRSHGHHHSHQEMPALNEDVPNGSDQMKYEKKDKIAKPSETDTKKYKKNRFESHNKNNEKDSVNEGERKSSHKDHKNSHKKSKSHKEEKKSKSKGSKKHKNKNDIMKEFERYQQFLKAQELAASGDGSGEASGEKVLDILIKESKKSKSKHHVTKKSKHKNEKETKKKNKEKKKYHHKQVIDSDSSGGEESEASGEEEEQISKKHKDDHKHKKKPNKSNAEKREGHTNSSTETEMPAANSTSNIAVNTTEVPKVSNKTENSVVNESHYSHSRMFKDRKESSSSEETANSIAVSQKGVSRNVTIHDTAPTTKANQQNQSTTQQQTKNLSPNIPKSDGRGEMDLNNNVHNVVGEQRKEQLKPEKQPTTRQSQNSTLLVRKPTTKGDTTTKTTTKPSTKPTTKPTTTPTTKQTTKSTTTPQPSTTVRTTKKKKLIVVKPTKPVKRGTIKPRHKKATKKVSTTSVPTLNIMTGDEDMNTGNIKPPTTKRKPKAKQHKVKTSNIQSDRKKLRKQKKIEGNIPSNVKRIRSTLAPRTRTAANHVFENHYGSLLTNAPTAPPIATFTANPYALTKPQPMQSQSGSAGTLGDIQLPEPPGNGNIVAGPPYYKQQGLPGNFPMNGPFNRNEIQGLPYGYQPRPDHSQDMNNKPKPQQYQDTRIMPTPLLSTPFGRDMPAQLPLRKPTVKPSMKPMGGKITTDINNNKDGAVQSARKVIERILNKPKPISPSLVPHINDVLTGKKSPFDIIHDILGKPHQQAFHPTISAHHVVTTKKQKPLPRGPEGHVILKNRPKEPQKTPPGQRKLNNAKPPTQKLNKKPTVNRLNDFFNKIKKMGPVKSTAHPKALAPKQTLPHAKVPESSAPVSPQQRKDAQCSVSQTLDNMVLVKGRQAGQFSKMPGYPDLPTCIKECCKTPTCDLLFKSGEVCYLVHCHDQQSCKTEPSKEPTIHTRILLFHKLQPKKQPEKPAICEAENAFGISWKATEPGRFATRSCPREAKGIAKRQCRDHARWFTPDFSGCTSDEYTNLREQIKHLGFTTSVHHVVSKLEDITTQTIDNSMIFGGDLVKATTILDGLSNFVIKNQAEKFGFQALRKFTRSASNLLDETNKQEWENAHEILRGPGRIMKSLENFGLVTAGKIPSANNMQPIVTNNMVMSVAHLSNVKRYVFPNYSMPILKKWTTKRDTIILPGSLFKSGMVKVASINYKTLAQFLPHQWNTANHVTFTDGFRVNSKVISSAIYPKPKQKINPPVTIILHHLKEVNSARTKCVYWDFTTNVKNGGSWSSDGCWVVTSNSTVTVCQCDHLTHFAVLMNLNDEDRISAKEQAKENTFALMWLGIPILVVLSVGAMYTCFAWTKAPRRRHVVVKDGKPRLPDDEVIVTKTIKEDFPGSPNRYLYSSYNSPSPSDLEWEHAWDFLTNSEFENWQDGGAFKRKRPRRKRLELRPPRILRDRRKKHNETSEYFLEGNSSSFVWKRQDDNEWSKDRITCLGKGIVDVSSEASQPVDSLEEFSDVTSVTDSKDGDKCSNSFENFAPDAISSPRLGYCTEPKYYSFVYKSDTSLKERDSLRIAFNATSEFPSERRSHHNSCSSLETLRTLHPSGVRKTKYSSTSSINTIGQRSFARFIERKWNSKISLSSTHSVTHSLSSGFLDKTWSSKYASSLSISTLARSVSARTINDDEDYMRLGQESVSAELGYGTFESSAGLSSEIMDMNISTISDMDEPMRMNDSGVVNKNIPTYDTNLLTPSKKPVELNFQDKYADDSSLNTSLIDDVNSYDWNISSWNNIKGNDEKNTDTEGIVHVEGVSSTDKAIVEDFLSKLLSFKKDLDNGFDCGNEHFDSASIDEGIALERLEPVTEKDNLGVKRTKEIVRDVTNGIDLKCEYNSQTKSSILCSSNKIVKKSSKSTHKQGIRQVTIPRTLRTRKNAQKPFNAMDKSTKSNAVTRSPSKHMRSYIALRQQSRYSDHEKQSVSSNEEKTKRRKKKILPKRQSLPKHIESEDSEYYTKDDVEESHVIDVNAASVVVESKDIVDSETSIHEEVTVIEEPVPFHEEELESSDDIENKLRRCVETSVFGVTLKRWKGQSRLYKTLKLDK